MELLLVVGELSDSGTDSFFGACRKWIDVILLSRVCDFFFRLELDNRCF